MEKKIHVVSDYDKSINEVAVLELLSKATEMATFQQSHVVLLCVQEENFEEALEKATQYGADQVYAAVFDCPVSAETGRDAYQAFLSDMISKDGPECVMFVSSDTGKELSIRLAVILNCGLTTECVDVYSLFLPNSWCPDGSEKDWGWFFSGP